jgi:hypothetical protein
LSTDKHNDDDLLVLDICPVIQKKGIEEEFIPPPISLDINKLVDSNLETEEKCDLVFNFLISIIYKIMDLNGVEVPFYIEPRAFILEGNIKKVLDIEQKEKIARYIIKQKEQAILEGILLHGEDNENKSGWDTNGLLKGILGWGENR